MRGDKAEREPSRRRMLKLIGTSGAIGIAGCGGGDTDHTPTSNLTVAPTDTTTRTPTNIPTDTPTDTPTEAETEIETETKTTTEEPKEWEVDPLDHDKLVGAEYYMWYWGEDGYGLHPNYPWTTHATYTPVLGEYDSRNESVVNQHIKWAVEHGINWFMVTWGNPNSRLNRVIQNTFMQAELVDHIKFSILDGFTDARYKRTPDGETDFDIAANRRQLRNDFRYLADHYFSDENYLHIDGRPVLYDYSALQLVGDVQGAFAEARAAIDADPYLIANPNFWKTEAGTKIHQIVRVYDAVHEYIPYHPSEEIRANFVENVAMQSREWRFVTEHFDIDYIPIVTPGLNDTNIKWSGRTHHPELERNPDRFRRLCSRLLNHMDPDLNAIIVTSFNEHPEGTVIEPTEEFGQTYLDIYGNAVARETPDYLKIESHPLLTLRFSNTYQPANYREDSSDTRELALMLGALTFFGKDNRQLGQFDIGIREKEPVLVDGVFGARQNPDLKIGTWRWLGGPTATASMYLDPMLASATRCEIYGSPIREAGRNLTAEVVWNGNRTDSVRFDDRLATYTASLE